ncbi:MAG: SDR family NAD(P)-dependent oxidoreductase [Immundisolibacter sp.]|uniref:SDR family NAD(P)-dependent oxidoreductase n=1 Tax=Immundisolibacter sp. TaxID=1934948 RepID=UPI003D0A716A
MPGRLQDKAIIVVGAGQSGSGGVIGNGRAAALLFAREGARCFLIDKDAASVEATADLIRAEGGVAATHVADSSDIDQAAGAVAACVARFGGVNVLHNNVGIGWGDGNADDIDPALWEQFFRVNVNGALWMARAAIPELRRAGGGAITFVSSIAGIRYAGDRMPRLGYATTKAALHGMVHHMAGQHGPDRIRTNAILPGYIDTPMTQQDAAARREREALIPLRRQGTGWDIGWAAVFLASDEASFVNGHLLVVDGGMTVQFRPD